MADSAEQKRIQSAAAEVEIRVGWPSRVLAAIVSYTTGASIEPSEQPGKGEILQ